MTSASAMVPSKRRFDKNMLNELLMSPPTEAPSEIVDGFLFLGDADQAVSQDCLSASNITHVINITIYESLKPHPDWMIIDGSPLVSEVGDGGPEMRKRLFFNLQDHEHVQISAAFSQSTAFIEDAVKTQVAPGVPSRVFVHCMAGRSRSVTLILAYLMSSRQMSLRQALDLVKVRRPMACPNVGFLKQLQQLEAELFPGSAPSELPLLFREMLVRFGAATDESPTKAFRLFMAARWSASSYDFANEEVASAEAVSWARASLLDAAHRIVDSWQPGWSGGAVQEVLLACLEELHPVARKDAVMLLKLLVTGEVYARLQCSSEHRLFEHKVGSVVQDAPFVSRLTNREVEENFRSLQQDASLREELRIDNPHEGTYFLELDGDLVKAGLLQIREA